MHRIDGPGATEDNRFIEGNPTLGIPPTMVTANWANAVQEEVVSVIAGAGMALDKDDNGQLKDAINALIAAAVGSIVFDPVSAMRDMLAGLPVYWSSLTVPLLSDGLPLGLPLDGAVVSLETYPRLSRVLCPAGNNAWSPAWYRCTAGGARDVAGGYIRMDDWRGGYPQVLDAGAGRAKSTVLVNTTNGSANITIVNNLSAGGTLTTPYTGSDGIYPGLAVSGAGIPAGTTVLSVAGTTVTLSAACTATGTSVEATVTGRVLGSWQGDAARNMQGYLQFLAGIQNSATGAFVLSYPAGTGISGGTTGSSYARYTFNSANVVPTAPTSRPAGPAINAIILV